MFGRQAHLALLSSAALLLAACASRDAVQPETESQTLAKEAAAAYKKADFATAASNYRQAIASAGPSSPETAAYKRHLAEVYREWALNVSYVKRDETSAEDYSQAIRLCEAALEIDPARKDKYEEMIAKFQGKISLLQYRAIATDEKLIPDGKPLKDQVEIYMTQARAYVQAALYVDAKKRYEKALAADPSNALAGRELSFVLAKLAERSSFVRKAEVAEVVWKKAAPFKPRSQKEAVTSAQTIKSLQETVIPHLELKKASLREAFAKFEAESASSWDGSLRFNFIGLNPNDGSWPLIDFKADGVPLGDAVYSVCEALGLDFWPGPNGYVAVFRKP